MALLSLRKRLSLAAALSILLLSCAPTPPPAAPRTGLSDYDVILKRGDGYYFKSRYAEAAAEYSRAVELERGRAEGYRFRGYALMALGEHGRAQGDFERALEVAPDYTEARLGLGILLFRQGKYGEAIEELTLVTDADPWNTTARYYTALACEKVGRLREAVEAYKGYIHCAVPRDDETIRHARERIRELEDSPQQ
jgi:tetratricopeptide (TPR) repeat protein